MRNFHPDRLEGIEKLEQDIITKESLSDRKEIEMYQNMLGTAGDQGAQIDLNPKQIQKLLEQEAKEQYDDKQDD